MKMFIFHPRKCTGPVKRCLCHCKMHFMNKYYSFHELLLLTPWSRVLLEKLTSSQLVKKFPALYGTWRFITVFTSARHLSLSSARSIQFMPSHLNSWSSILMLSSHPCLGLAGPPFPSGFPNTTLSIEKI